MFSSVFKPAVTSTTLAHGSQRRCRCRATAIAAVIADGAVCRHQLARRRLAVVAAAVATFSALECCCRRRAAAVVDVIADGASGRGQLAHRRLADEAATVRTF